MGVDFSRGAEEKDRKQPSETDLQWRGIASGFNPRIRLRLRLATATRGILRKILRQHVPQALELPRHVVGAVVLHGLRVSGRCLQPRQNLRDVCATRVRRRALADDRAHLGRERQALSERARLLLHLCLRPLPPPPSRRVEIPLRLLQDLRNLVGRRELARGLILLAHREWVRAAAQQHGHGLAVV